MPFREFYGIPDTAKIAMSEISDFDQTVMFWDRKVLRLENLQ